MDKIKLIFLISFWVIIFSTGCVNALYDKDGYCDVHKVKMKKRFAWVNYGLAESWPDEKFPNTKSPIQGGCVVRIKKFGIKYVCKNCTERR